MANEIPPLPPGFRLDSAPPLPPGFIVEGAAPAADQRYTFGGRQPQQNESALRTAGVFSQGTLEGAASTIDAVLNAPSQAADLVKAAVGIPLIELGSPAVRQFAYDFTAPAGPYPFAGNVVAGAREMAGAERLVPQTAPERFAESAGQFLGASAASGGLTPQAATKSIPAKFGTPSVQAVEAAQGAAPVTSAIGAGLGAQAAEEVAPDSQLAQVAGGVVGGLLGSKAPAATSAVTGKVAETAKAAAAGMTPGRQKVFDQLKAAENAPDIGIRADVVPDEVIAKYKIVGNKAVPDQKGQYALKQGFTPGAVADVKTFDPETRRKAAEMVKVARRAKASQTYAIDNRPGDIAGQSVMQRFNYVLDQNKRAGAQLDEIARGMSGKVDGAPAISRFREYLDDIGVKIDAEGKPNFVGSNIEGLSGAESVVKRVIARIASANPNDPYQLHKLKRYIDNNVTYGKGSQEGLTGDVERAVKSLRADVDGVLDSTFPAYNNVNTRYSETIRGLDEFQSLAGTKIDLTGEGADKAVGVLLRRLTSNAQSRIPLANAVSQLDDIAKKYGAEFTDNPKSLLMFANELDSAFGPFASTSLRGEVSKGVADAAQAAQAPMRTATIKAAEKAAEKLRGVNEENKFKAIEDLLKKYP